MAGMLATVADLYQKVSFVDSFIFFLYCLIGSAIYFFFRIYMPQRLKERERELKNEQRRMELTEKAFQELEVMLRSNTETIKDFSQAISVLNQTFEKVSDKLYSHDERSAYTNQILSEVKDELVGLKEKAPTSEEINRIHSRLDDLARDGASKGDVKMIVDKIDQMNQTVHQISGKLS